MAARARCGHDSAVHHALHGLAENPALPPALVDRLIMAADADLAGNLARRPDLNRGQILALARFEAAAVALARDGRLTVDGMWPTR